MTDTQIDTQVLAANFGICLRQHILLMLQSLLTSNPADLNDIMLDMVAVGERRRIRFPRDFALLFKQMLYFDRCHCAF